MATRKLTDPKGPVAPLRKVQSCYSKDGYFDYDVMECGHDLPARPGRRELHPRSRRCPLCLEEGRTQ